MRLLDLFVFKYNRTDFHELNLDWIISDMRTLAETLQNFISLNTIKYADPIQWNIATQYESNTVVVDPATGTAYLSTQPVPSGVALTNSDYWTVIFDLDIAQANNNITLRDDGNNVLSTFTSVVGDWLLWNGTLYKVIADIGLSQAYVIGYNIERYTVEMFINDYVTALTNEISNISNNIGDLNDLSTTDKTSIVNAINELVSDISSINSSIGDLNNLSTTDKTSIVNAINELVTTINNVISSINLSQSFHSPFEYGAVGDGVADDTTALQNCIDDNSNVIINGDFKISSPINLHSNLLIVGDGKIINDQNMVTTLFGESVNEITIKDISFVNGTRTTHFDTETANIFITDAKNIHITNIKDDSHNKGSSITLDHTDNFEIDNCIITKSGYCGILLLGNCHYGNIHDNVVEVDNYTGYNNTYGIATSFTPYPRSLYPNITDRSNECTDIIIDSNNVYTSLGWWEGIDSHAGQRISITNNTVKGFMCGIVLTTGNYTTFDVSPKQCVVSNNNIIGGIIDDTRNRLVGIILAGNDASIASRLGNVIKNNRISDMLYIRSNVRYGYGILITGDGMDIISNMFTNNVENCIVIDSAGRIAIKDNVTMYSLGNFIYFNGISNKIEIDNNLHQQGKDFYYIDSNVGLSYVSRSNNKINNATWKDGTDSVTNITDFVPDYVATNPSASNYKPFLGEAKNYAPAANSPEGWLCNGTTWLAKASLT